MKMAYYDDEEEEDEVLPQYVLDYHFVDDKDTPVSFSELPVVWGDGDENEMVLEELESPLVLRGTGDDGIQTVYIPVKAWKFELCYVHPEISVLSKGNKWILLQKPRKAFEPTIRNILVTVHWLHFIKKNPDASQSSTWKHLQIPCSSFGAQPSVNDLEDHMKLIVEAGNKDKDIQESKAFLSFVAESQTGSTSDEDVEATKDGGKEQAFDQVCAICDDGGNILCCNGRCLRSFHPTFADGVESKCASLRFRNNAEYEAIPIFKCENCIYEQHQCFACGRLGSSARSSSQEVFPCASSGTCAHFYHPECVARLLHAGNATQAEELRVKITAGGSFTCPAHKCFSCKQPEDTAVDGLQFAICRRCPKAYHKKCLPRCFVFQHESDENNLARAWEHLLPYNRILIYCMEHKIIPRLKTPARNHLVFPGVERTHTSELLTGQQKSEMSKRANEFGGYAMDKGAMKKPKQVDRLHYDEILDSSSKEKRCSLKDFKPLKISNTIEAAKREVNKISSVSARSSTVDKSKLLFRNNLSVNLGSSQLKSKQENIASSKIKSTIPDKLATLKEKMSLPLRDTEMEERILTLMEDVRSSFDIEELKGRNKFKSTTLGWVEGSVKAVQTALQKLEEGCSIQDAKIICPPEVLDQIFKWKKKLKIHLAPFLHGARYTSFGRHFTQVGKLKEIVDRVHWYVQDDDMIVDFCCGSNDFSCLLKERLEKIGKPCSFKNYDIIQAKNDFSFEKRNWMDVNPNELPDGSRLIMGLNPPFGVNASLANAFISKALKFSPKLIVLIVPEETTRLDEKAPYDLIWEDKELLSGKSFYLPGSVDVNDKQIEQWNNRVPPLYLWSRWDWTDKHMEIARRCRQIV